MATGPDHAPEPPSEGDYAIFMLDTEGRVTSWNAGAERILGYASAQILGHSFERFFTARSASSA